MSVVTRAQAEAWLASAEAGPAVHTDDVAAVCRWALAADERARVLDKLATDRYVALACTESEAAALRTANERLRAEDEVLRQRMERADGLLAHSLCDRCDRHWHKHRRTGIGLECPGKDE